MNCMDGNIEISAIKYKLPFTHDIYVFNVYRLPNGDVDIFVKYLQSCVSLVRSNKECDIFIRGDFNINVTNPNYCEYRHHTFTFFIQYGWSKKGLRNW